MEICYKSVFILRKDIPESTSAINNRNLRMIRDTHLVSTLVMYVSRVRPEPHGSMRKYEPRSTAHTPCTSMFSECSTDIVMSAHAPLLRSLLQYLKIQKQHYSLTV